MNITKDELEIFSRQLIIKDFDEKSFKNLQKKTVSIIGLGGIGCPLAYYLVASGIKKLNLFDNDIIKKHNLNRQILYSIKEIGKKKSLIAKKKLKEVNPKVLIKSYNLKINSKNLDLLKDSSIIIDTSDNWKTMKLINKFSVKKNLPLLSASAINYDIQIILFENKKNTHLCLDCIFPNKNEPDLARCDTVGILGTAAGLAGIISAQKTINFLMKFKQKNNLLTLIDTKSISISHIKTQKNNKCKLFKKRNN